jgi:hypothetical protein
MDITKVYTDALVASNGDHAKAAAALAAWLRKKRAAFNA